MEMNSPIGPNVLDNDAQGLVGKPLDRVDGRLKVTGGARYSYEVLQGPATTYGYVVEASIGKGRIKSIDTLAAERAPGRAPGAHTSKCARARHRQSPRGPSGAYQSGSVLLRPAGRLCGGRNFRAGQGSRLSRARQL